MDSMNEDDLCWLQIEDHRMLLIKNIEPSRITPYLRQCQVISAEDEEQIFSDPTLVLRSRRVGALLDILQRTGVKGHTAFLESLELDYPQLYSRITGKEPNKTFSILIDTAGESGLTQFLMSELSVLQRALQEERRRRQQACAVAKEQEAWSQQLQLKEQELRKLTERLAKSREERELASQQLEQLQQHNYTLMCDINTLNQDRSAALLANRDLQIEVERVKNSLLQAENQTRLLRRRTLRPLQERRSLALPAESFFSPGRTEEKKTEEVKKEGEQEEKKEEEEKKKKEDEERGPPVLQKISVLTTVLRLKRDLHRAEELRNQVLEEKEELELLCAQLRGDVHMFRQRNKQTLRHLDEVVRERDKALSAWAELQEDTRRLLQEKDQYREQVRRLTQQRERLDLQLLRAQGEELQLRTRLSTLTCGARQWGRSVSSEEEEEEEPAEVTRKGSGGEKKEGAGPVGGGATEEERGNTAPWEKQTDACLTSSSASTFSHRRKRALRSKLVCKELSAGHHDDSSSSDITEWD